MQPPAPIWQQATSTTSNETTRPDECREGNNYHNNQTKIFCIMELLTSKQIDELAAKFPLYSQDGKGLDAVVSYKFFFPAGRFTWYITECSREGDAVTMFGVTVGLEPVGEYGYISFDELQGLNVHGLTVERDLHFTPAKLRDLGATEPNLRPFLEAWADDETDNQ